VRPVKNVIAIASTVVAGLSVFLLCALAGCGPQAWERIPPPDIQHPAALASVEHFTVTNGWNMYTNQGGVQWEELDTNCVIGGLPWTRWRGQKFQALTRNGILFVLLDPGWHHDYSGVAYNPHTNHFPECIRGFKPISEHWYVWMQPEFQSARLKQKYA